MGGRLTLTAKTRFVQGGAKVRFTYVIRNTTGIVFADSCLNVALDPMWGFYTEAGHWVLEMVDRVVIDGTSLNDRYGYDESFHYRLLGNEAVCLAHVGDHYRISVDGVLLPPEYDDVEHHNCCDPSRLNPTDIDGGFFFFAWRDGVPLLVEVTTTE